MIVTKQALVQSLSEDLILELTSRLVAIPTPNPPGQEKACADFIADTLQGWGVEVERVFEPDRERPQVVAWQRGSGAGPTVIINAHMDTVGEGRRDDWRFPPFQVTRQGSRLYGRGACDMKGSLAINMAIMKTLQEAKTAFPGTLMFQAVMGEEMDEPGTRTLLQQGYTGDYAIVLEPTDLRIGPASRGVCWYKITLTGPAVHCGLAAPDAPDVMAHFATIATALAEYHQRIARQTHPLSPNPSCRITDVQAGEAHNSTVGRCEFIIDRRMLPGETPEQIAAELQEILVRHSHPEIETHLAFIEWNEPVETSLDSPLIDALKHNIKTIGGRTPEIWGPPYGSDVRNFIYDAGIPSVNFGAGDYRVCHQPNEFVEVDDLMTCARIVLGTVIDLLQPNSALG
ncbi:MAG: M20 family metallopeptidase [Anaerolineaceae bacterium]|nr:M20 family metallopeptidase [Anaerolineaceae bacterium]MCB9101404.1 M20 family metallopeptidase [Anaerolineales bacterium]